MTRTIRLGKGKGMGKGYKNLIAGYDKRVHQQSAQGIKQAQRKMPFIPTPMKDRELAKVIRSLDPFQERIFLTQLSNGVSPKKAIEVVVNMVEGDRSQLGKELEEYADKQGWLKDFDMEQGSCSLKHGNKVDKQYDIINDNNVKFQNWRNDVITRYANKGNNLQEVISYIDEVLLPRFEKEYGNKNYTESDLTDIPLRRKIDKTDLKSFESHLSVKFAPKRMQHGSCSLKHGRDPDSKFNAKQLKVGTKVETEHTDDRSVAKQIAKAHLDEDPKYYDKLKKVETLKKKIEKDPSNIKYQNDEDLVEEWNKFVTNGECIYNIEQLEKEIKKRKLI